MVTRDDGFQEHGILLLYVRYDVDVIVHFDDQQLLVRIFLLVWVFPYVQKVIVFNVEQNIMKTHSTVFFQPLFFVRIPIKDHEQKLVHCVHFGNTLFY